MTEAALNDSRLVMVVEDDDALRESVCEVLEDDGYTALSVEGGERALERLRSDEQKPELILLDLMMPGMTGWDFREEQLHDGALAPIPTVVMTANRDLHGISANEVIFKPVTREKLLSVVHRYTPPPQAPERRSDLDRMLERAGEYGSLIRAKDWSRTPLGPIESWPRSLLAHLGMVLELPSPAIIFWGPQQTQLYNAGYSQIMGPRHPRFFGEPYKDCWPDTYPIIYPWMQRVLGKGEVVRVEKEHIPVTRYGSPEETYFTFTFSPLRDDRGEIAGIFQPVTEVTDVVLSERRAETIRLLSPRPDSTNPMKDVVHALSANPKDVPFFVISLWDEGRKRLELGPRTEGLDLEFEEIARTVFDSKAPREVEVEPAEGEALSPWPEPVRRAFAVPLVQSTADVPLGVVVFGLSPRLRMNDAYRSFLEVAAGQVAIASSTTHALREAQRRAELLTEVDRAKTTFFSNVSHEFRTPLTLMLGPVADLLDGAHGELGEEQHRQLDLIHRNALRLQKLVNSLLDFSRIEAGRVQATYEAVDLAALTRGLAAAFETAADRAGLAFKVDCPPLGERVFVDREMWEKIVLNLLSNAFKFTLEGSIEVSLRAAGGEAELRVSDTGTGIPAEELPRLFERFHRVEGAAARTHEGSGIGLALVSELVKLHEGSVSVESRAGGGTSFIVKIPRGTAHLPKDRLGTSRPTDLTSTGAEPYIDEALGSIPREQEHLPSVPPVNAPTRVATPAPQPPHAGRARVLLADDNADMREYVRPHLERHWTVETASDGASALQAARANPPDLVLTDVMMPKMNGLELVRHLKADERTSGIPVIVVSAQTTEEAKLEGLRAGAADYLTKPFSARELVARVRTHLELARLRNEVRAQREQLYSLFMQAPVPICVFRGPELVFELVNPLYEEVAGVKNPVGKPLFEALPETRGQGYAELLREVMTTGKAFHGTEMLVRLDRDHDGVAEDTFFNFTFEAIRDPEGVTDRVMAVVYDVTEQVHARQRVEESERKYRAIFEGAEVSIWEQDFTEVRRFTEELKREHRVERLRPLFESHPQLVDEALALIRVRNVNPATLRLLDASSQEELLNSLHKIFLPETPAAWREQLIAFTEGHTFYSAEVPLQTLTGRRVDVLLAMNIPPPEEPANPVLASLADISAQKRALRVSEMFVGILGHDLRNPLTSISMASSLLERLSDNPKLTKPAARIRNSAARMERMISQLLDFTRVRLGRGIPLEASDMELAELSSVVIGELETGTGCKVHLQPHGDTSGTWDRDRLAQLLSNLVGNACHHGTADRTVTVRVDGSSPDRVKLEVENAGAIPHELLPVLFEPLRHSDNVKRSRGQSSGLGLGLYITQQIVLAHGGEIRVESDEANGTRFLIDLPRRPPAAASRVFGPGAPI